MPAKVIARVQGLFPNLTADLLALVKMLILPVPARGQPQPGREVYDRVCAPWLTALTRLGLVAAERLHQLPGPFSAERGAD